MENYKKKYNPPDYTQITCKSGRLLKLIVKSLRPLSQPPKEGE